MLQDACSQRCRSATELNLNVKLHPVWPFLNTHKTQIFVDCFALFQSIFQMLYSPQPSESCPSPSPSRAPWPGLWFSACGLHPTFAGQGPLGVVCTVWISKGLQLRFGKLRLCAVPQGVAGVSTDMCSKLLGHYRREVSWAQIKESPIGILGSKIT